ncbi:MAG: bifunctional phosphoribosyl-AMP cyclohydrolase/phosphoribosyl-ATP diphosphatase HisIE [Myxococcota bacterium]
MNLADLKWDASGLVTAVVQDRHTGEVRMVGHANLEAVRSTLRTGQAHFFSRSRRSLWRKGESSGHTLDVHEVWADCDGDAVIYLVDPEGPTCHTGRRTCFFRHADSSGRFTDEVDRRADPTLVRLWDTLLSRSRTSADSSYTKSLLERGAPEIGRKLREEADELARAVADEPTERVASEAADVLYHLCVGLLSRDVELRDVEAELARRFGRSGHEEKASRKG